MNDRYEYVHRAGYGSDDHMAHELIARAARILGFGGTDDYIAGSVGLASHAVPMDRPVVCMALGYGVRKKMEAALRAARDEFHHRPSCCVEVVRRRKWSDDDRIYTEELRGGKWVTIATDWLKE